MVFLLGPASPFFYEHRHHVAGIVMYEIWVWCHPHTRTCARDSKDDVLMRRLFLYIYLTLEPPVYIKKFGQIYF